MDDSKDQDNLMEDTCTSELDETEEDVLEETTQSLMTDMKLEDESDYIRNMDPGDDWIYHIEVFPWNVEDMGEAAMKLMKLAKFSHLSMKQKMSNDFTEKEKTDDLIQKRERIGCFHFYVDTWLTAKTLLRSLTWKTMFQKQLNFEVTRKYDDGHIDTATYFVDTYNLSKIRFRGKTKGEFKDRSAKITNIPGTITREFLDVVFSRAYVAYDGCSTDGNKPKGNLLVKLQDMENFNGSYDLDCLIKGSCRSLVLAFKSIYICGHKILLAANNQQTMVAPPMTHDLGVKAPKGLKAGATASIVQALNPGQMLGRGILPPPDATVSVGRGRQKDGNGPSGKIRGLMASAVRPASAPFPRAGPGMPVPMTGRQKMNEKLRRMNPGSAPNVPSLMSGAGGANRGPGSVGDSFKHEIASLQNQLQISTQALEAQIARLQHESHYFNRPSDVRGYNDIPSDEWDERNFEDNFEYEVEEYGDYGPMHHDDFGPPHPEQMHQYHPHQGFSHHQQEQRLHHQQQQQQHKQQLQQRYELLQQKMQQQMHNTQTQQRPQGMTPGRGRGGRLGPANLRPLGPGVSGPVTPLREEMPRPAARGQGFRGGMRGRVFLPSRNAMLHSEGAKKGFHQPAPDSVFW